MIISDLRPVIVFDFYLSLTFLFRIILLLYSLVWTAVFYTSNAMHILFINLFLWNGWVAPTLDIYFFKCVRWPRLTTKLTTLLGWFYELNTSNRPIISLKVFQIDKAHGCHLWFINKQKILMTQPFDLQKHTRRHQVTCYDNEIIICWCPTYKSALIVCSDFCRSLYSSENNDWIVGVK